MKIRSVSAAVVGLSAIVLATGVFADAIKTTSGDIVVGQIISFRPNAASPVDSSFVIEVDGRPKTIPLSDVDQVLFDRGTAARASGKGDRRRRGCKTGRRRERE
jgi:hypothetical protein